MLNVLSKRFYNFIFLKIKFFFKNSLFVYVIIFIICIARWIFWFDIALFSKHLFLSILKTTKLSNALPNIYVNSENLKLPNQEMYSLYHPQFFENMNEYFDGLP